MGKLDLAAKIAAKLSEAAQPVKEQKMLQGMYRGYAGDYNTAKAAQDSGLVYATPQRAAAEAYAKNRSKQAFRRGVDDTPHVDMLLVDPFAGRRYGHSTLGTGAQGPIRTLAGEYTPEQIGDVTNLYAEGGRVGMEHTRSSGQDASTQPLSGSALKALVRGWIAGTAGIPGDVEELARKGINWSFGPGGVKVDETPVLRNTEGFKQSLPGKQQGDEAVSTAGSLFGGFGVPQMVRGAKGALTLLANAPRAPMAGSMAAQRGVIKAPGGNWLSGSVEDALRGLKPRVRTEGVNGHTATDTLADQAMGQFVDKQLTRYVKNDMATERDPVRALAERGVLHFDPTDYYLAERRVHPSGEALEKLGKSPHAARWENISDNVLRNEPAGDLLADRMMSTGENPHLKQNPWLAKVPPETKVSRVDRGYDVTQDLGFNHLIDELRNATNPNSGLPANLMLKYDALDRVTVPQAVERVAQINQWRAEQKVAADFARANNAATALHKDYPDKGFKWVELSAGESPSGPASYEYLERKKALQDALKYEGDTMGHCVGGYCDDVASGNTRIFSLRDAKGQPHVTVEVQPGDDPLVEIFKQLPREEQLTLRERALGAEAALNDKFVIGREADANRAAVRAQMLKERPELGELKTPERITQIKGKQNLKPKDTYLPFVQDFVQSGKWSDVGDLQNTGLEPISTQLTTPQIDYLRKAGVEVPVWGTPEQNKALYEDLVSRFRAEGLIKTNPKGFAEGGSVKAPTWDDAFNEFQKAHQAQYDIGIDRPWNKDEDAARAKRSIDQRYIDALKQYDPTLTPDQSVLGVDAQPNAYQPKPESGGWFSQQLSNIGNIFRPVVQSVDDFAKDARSAAGGTLNEAAKLGSEATGGIVSPDVVKAAAAIAYLMSTGDAAGANSIKDTALSAGMTEAEIAAAMGPAPAFAWTDAVAGSLDPSLFSTPAISIPGGATYGDVVMAQLGGQGNTVGMNLSNVGQTADQISNAAELSKFIGGNTSGLVGNTASSAAGPFGPMVNVGRAVGSGVPLAKAATGAVGSVALGKAVQEAARQTGLPAPLLSVGANSGLSGEAPNSRDLGRTAVALYNSDRATQRQRKTRSRV